MALAAAAVLPFHLHSSVAAANLDLKAAQDLADLCVVADNEPRPTRADAAKRFVDWARADPRHMSEAPVDALIGAGVGAVCGYVYDQSQKSKGH